MSDTDNRYSIHRGLFTSGCLVVILLSFIRACSYSQPKAHATPFPTPAAYREEFCSSPRVFDFRDRNPKQIAINLHEGQFCDEYYLPNAWKQFNTTKSKNSGDYIAVWCNGSPHPRAIEPYFSDGSQVFNYCAAQGDISDHFWVSGKGSLLLTLLAVNPQYSAEAQKHEEEIRYQEIPVEPDGGQQSDYEVTIKECHRSSDTIECNARATNKTDASLRLHLTHLRGVDDEGNSFRADIGGITFSTGEDSETIFPSIPVLFSLHVPDPHLNAKHINVMINAWCQPDRRIRDANLFFRKIPIQ